MMNQDVPKFQVQLDPEYEEEVQGQALVRGEYSTKIASIASGETKSVTFTNPLSDKSYLVYVISNGVWVVKGMPPLTTVLPDLTYSSFSHSVISKKVYND